MAKHPAAHARHASSKAAPPHHVSDAANGGQFWGVVLALVLVVAAIIALRMRAAAKRSAVVKNVQEEIAAVVEAVKLAPLQAIHPEGFHLLADETFYWQEAARWCEFRTQRRYESTYGGTSVRIARGVSLRAGSSSGASRSVAVPEVTSGEVFLSNRRLIFIGPSFSREVKLDSVLRFEAGDGFMHLDLPNKNAVQVETGNDILKIELDKILYSDAQPAKPPAEGASPAAAAK